MPYKKNNLRNRRRRQSRHWRMAPPKVYGNFKQIMVIVADDFAVIGSSF